MPAHVLDLYGAPPSLSHDPIPSEVKEAIRHAVTDGVTQGDWGADQERSLAIIRDSADPRIAWILGDAVRYAWDRERYNAMTEAASALLGYELRALDRWTELTNHLIAWEIPAYPSYLEDKRAIFTHFGEGWDALFVEGEIDWRLVSWGGVGIDDRPFGQSDGNCACIPAADNPEIQTAEEADWLSDDAIVFGITVNGEARAYPRRIMEVREMVNDTLGGRDLGIPYCTLCGAAQAYYTDEMPDGVVRPILRTSGLLIRSNKVMYDLVTHSIFDTFLGKAVTGPLAEIGLVLEPVSVVTSAWGAWKAAHPDTTVLVEALALGRNYDFRNGRDANGPIFPIGAVDPRLPVHEDVIGILTESGQPIAFPRSAALAALRSGAEITAENIRLILDAGGLRAVGATGEDLGSFEAYWFAWSQFYPGTALWPQL